MTGDLTVQQLIDAAPDALVVLDVSGAIVLVNRIAHEMLGYDIGELLGMPFTYLVSTGDSELASHPFAQAQALATPPTVVGTVDVIAHQKDGTHLPVEIGFNSLETGERKLVVVALRDITHRRRREQEYIRLLATEQDARLEAEAAVRLRDAFLATVTHDLRQPLTTIKARA
jgi:PAS domain S-box-containing protein